VTDGEDHTIEDTTTKGINQAQSDQTGSGNQNEGEQILTEEEINAFIESEKLAASEGNNASIDSIYTPQIDMEFDTKDDAHHFFNFYAFLAGFKVVNTHTYRSTSRKKKDDIYKIELRCHCYGKPKKKKVKGDHEEEEEQIEWPILEENDGNIQDKGEKRDTNVQVKTDCKVVMGVKDMGNGK
jgi:hypothetical protein